MKHFPFSGTLPILALVSMTACVDKDYDLSDIDTTTEIKVKDLTLPVNIDPIKLGDIISVEEDSEFNTIQIGNQTVYAVNKSGSFTSNDILIPGFSAAAPTVEGITMAFEPGVNLSNRAGGELEFPLSHSESTSVEYSATGIDEAIISVEALGTETFNITVSFDASSAASLATLELTDLKISLPKGLDIASTVPATVVYSAADGLMTIPSLQLVNGIGEISLSVAGLKDMEQNGYAISNHNLSINQEITITEATLKVTPTGNPAGTIDRIAVDVDFGFSELKAESFTGKVRYAVEGINIDPVEIKDLPDFLAGNETDIVLANPQIYLNLTNPVGKYGLSYQSGVNIIPVRNGMEGNVLTLDNNAKFRVEGTEGATNLYLSPSAVSNIPSGFDHPAPLHYGFASLSNAIAGAGIPQELRFELVDPEIPEQRVTDFRLGETLTGVEGSWEFLAPLAFKSGSNSTIFYTADGWNDEDVDAITITTLSISMVADNTLPVDVTISGYPIDVNGNSVPGAEILPATIRGGAIGEQLELQVKGTITHLDGITLKIEMGSGNEEALSPDQTLTLHDIRAKVSGSYIKEL